MFICWAESTFAEANTPAPAKTFRKKPRLLLIAFPFETERQNFQKWVG
jgi:hypothetical protein